MTSKLETTRQNLEKLVSGARNFQATATTLYENQDTGTLVLSVLTDNARYVDGTPTEFLNHITWEHYLIGTPEGYADSDCHVENEAYIGVGEITEDDEKVVIERSGTKTVHFGLQVQVGNLEFEKSKMKSYEQAETEEGN